MIKTFLTAFVVAGILGSTAQAQTTPYAGNRPAGTSSAGKTGQDNSGNLAPNRSSTAGNPAIETSNNPVDATGKPVGTTQSTTTGTSKTRKPKK